MLCHVRFSQWKGTVASRRRIAAAARREANFRASTPVVGLDEAREIGAIGVAGFANRPAVFAGGGGV
jgi:hypothetical protein